MYCSHNFHFNLLIMKTIILSFFLLVAIKSYSIVSDTIYFPLALQKYHPVILDCTHDQLTITTKGKSKLWKISKDTIKVDLVFEFNESCQKKIFKKIFSGDSCFERTKRVLIKDRRVGMLCKVQQYIFDVSGEVYAFVSGVNAVPHPEYEYDMQPFFAVLKITKGEVDEIYPVDSPLVNNEYSLFEPGTAYKRGNKFYFTIIKMNVSKSGNYFIGSWELANNERLAFKEILPIEIPSFNLKNNLAYGLISFIEHKDNIMFYSNPTLIDLKTSVQRELTVKNMPDFKMPQMAYGGTFDIDFSVCDFAWNDSTYFMLVRKKNNFYKVSYSWPGYTYLKEEELVDIFSSNLSQPPIFNDKGEIFINPKEKNCFIIFRL